MPKLLSAYATPFVTGLFVVSLISGLALFFHVGPRGFHGMHEWLSLVLIIPFALHVWRNWRPLSIYLRGAPMAIAMALSLVAAAVFLIPSDQPGGGPPHVALARQMMKAPLAAAAPALGAQTEALAARLSAAGFTVGDPQQSLGDIAKASGKTDVDLIRALTRPAR